MVRKLITKKGLEKLKQELQNRSTAGREKIADKLDEAKGIGDLSENSAYISALEEYQFNEARIKELTEYVTNLKVAPDKSNDIFADIGDTVQVRDVTSKQKRSFTLVGEGEGDPLRGQVSVNSVVGKALVGKKVGDTVKISLPSGKKEYTIVKLG